MPKIPAKVCVVVRCIQCNSGAVLCLERSKYGNEYVCLNCGTYFMVSG